VKFAVDTNVLVRYFVNDDRAQYLLATKLMLEAELIAITTPCLCELVWVLGSVYGFGNSEVSILLRTLLKTRSIVMDFPAVEAGLAVLDAGGDFADGVIAFEGNLLGGETFVSFDKKAVVLLTKQKKQARLLP
jgi:predicted nucleic-acid-binding protein